jgi:hypothetical protein
LLDLEDGAVKRKALLEDLLLEVRVCDAELHPAIGELVVFLVVSGTDVSAKFLHVLSAHVPDHVKRVAALN